MRGSFSGGGANFLWKIVEEKGRRRVFRFDHSEFISSQFLSCPLKRIRFRIGFTLRMRSLCTTGLTVCYSTCVILDHQVIKSINESEVVTDQILLSAICSQFVFIRIWKNDNSNFFHWEFLQYLNLVLQLEKNGRETLLNWETSPTQLFCLILQRFFYFYGAEIFAKC